MSWWVYVCKDGYTRHGYLQCWDAYERNVTYNNGSIFSRALGTGFRSLDGMLAIEAADICQTAIDVINKNRLAFDKLAPENNWGGVEDSLEVLKGIHVATAAHPDAVVIVS